VRRDELPVPKVCSQLFVVAWRIAFPVLTSGPVDVCECHTKFLQTQKDKGTAGGAISCKNRRVHRLEVPEVRINKIKDKQE
jgi:hypothetical protein